jgi:hypothetical protein
MQQPSWRRDAAYRAVESLLDWPSPLRAPAPELPALPARFADAAAYAASFAPIAVEEARAAVRQALPAADACPLSFVYTGEHFDAPFASGNSAAASSSPSSSSRPPIVRTTFRHSKRAQQEWEAERRAVGRMRGWTPAPASRALVLLSPNADALELAAVGRDAPAVVALAVGGADEHGGTSLLELQVHRLHFSEAVASHARDALRAAAAAGVDTSTRKRRRPSEDGAPDAFAPARDVFASEAGAGSVPTRWFVWSLPSAVTSLRELEAVFSVRDLRPQLALAILNPLPERRSVAEPPQGRREVERFIAEPSLAQQRGRLRLLSDDFRRLYLGADFNTSQRRAIEAALSSEADDAAAKSALESGEIGLCAGAGITLVQGPPGTGKTTTILGLINSLHLGSFASYYEHLLGNGAPSSRERPSALPAPLSLPAPAQAPPPASIPEPWPKRASAVPHVVAAVPIAPRPGSTALLMAGLSTTTYASPAPLLPQASSYLESASINGHGSLRNILTSKAPIEACLERVSSAFALKPRILVSAPSNTAIDGIVMRIVREQLRSGAVVPGRAPPQLSRYRPPLRRIGDACGAEVRAVPGVYLEAEVDRLIASYGESDESLASYRLRILTDRGNILLDVERLRAQVHGSARWEEWIASGAPSASSPLPELLAAYSSRLVYAADMWEMVRNKLARLKVLTALRSSENSASGSSSSSSGMSRSEARRLLRHSLLDEAQIVFTTTSSAALSTLESFVEESGRPFSICIIDEAAQAVEPSTLIPLRYGAREVVLVGDPLQLPATILSRECQRAGYDRSLFARLARGGRHAHMLEVQYRMHPAISAFPSQHFYDGRLRDGDNVLAGSRTLPLHSPPGEGGLPPLLLLDVVSGRMSGGRRAPTGANATQSSFANEFEADVVIKLLHFLHAWRGIDAATGERSVTFKGTVGVITFYRSQLSLLQSRFVR